MPHAGPGVIVKAALAERCSRPVRLFRLFRPALERQANRAAIDRKNAPLKPRARARKDVDPAGRICSRR